MSRRHEALEMRIAGRSYRQIACALHISVNQAYKDVQTMLRDIPQRLAERAEQVRHLELARLDALAAALWPKVLDGEPAACAVYLKGMERRAKLLGLDERVPGSGDAEFSRPLLNIPTRELFERLDRLRARLGPRADVPSSTPQIPQMLPKGPTAERTDLESKPLLPDV